MDYDPRGKTSSTSEGSVDAPVLPRSESVTPTSKKNRTLSKKRKTTYYARRDEIETLREELTTLHAKLKEYEQRPRPTSWSLSNAVTANAFLSSHVDHNSLIVAGTQSLTSAYNLALIQQRGAIPLRSYIHLPADPHARMATMAAVHDLQLVAAERFMAERTRHMDLRVHHRQIDQFELPNGDATAMTFFITPFTSGHSLRQVFDALMFFLVHQETSIFEQLGILTVRESDAFENHKCGQTRLGQTRLVSSLPCGLEMEWNAVNFAKCVDATDTSPAYAVGTMDFVDQDDLYPYRPDICLRKELTGAITLHEVPSPSGGPPTISMVRWGYIRIPAPTFKLSPEAETAVTNEMLQWCDVIPEVMNAQLTNVVPAM